MEQIIIDILALILFILVHYFSSRITYDTWRMGGEEYDPSEVSANYFEEGGPRQIPFYKKVFSLVVLAILVTLFFIARSQENFKMQQVVLTMITLYCLFWFYVVFNVFVVLRNRVREALGNLESQLARRSNLIENMASIVKQYAEHEKEVFENVSQSRSGVIGLSENLKSARASQERIAESLGNLIATAEKYPKLKADKSFFDLQKQLTRTESMIGSARSYYNDCVSEYNTQIEIFPAKPIAKIGNFKKYEFFKGEKKDRLKISV